MRSCSSSTVVETLGPRVKVGKAELFERTEKILDGLSVLP